MSQKELSSAVIGAIWEYAFGDSYTVPPSLQVLALYLLGADRGWAPGDRLLHVLCIKRQEATLAQRQDAPQP